jgi:arylsulfatase A-like enzyme
MKTSPTLSLLLIGSCAILGCPVYAVTESSADFPKPERMNVIMILADDLGWSDTTLYGNTVLYETPNIERLAARGMTFTHAYSASPLCSPTRASILTGQNPARIGITTPNCHLPDINLTVRAEASGPHG